MCHTLKSCVGQKYSSCSFRIFFVPFFVICSFKEVPFFSQALSLISTSLYKSKNIQMLMTDLLYGLVVKFHCHLGF